MENLIKVKLLTKKEIINNFLKDCKENNFKEPSISRYYAPDTKEFINCIKFSNYYNIIITKNNTTYDKAIYYDGTKIKSHKKNKKLHSLVGPAYISIENNELTYYYYINGKKFNSRRTYKNFIKKALETNNFNRYKNIKILEIHKEIYIHYNRTEQLEKVTKRIDFLKVVEELENKKEI